ncbi:actin-related protein 2/3 complex subunit 5 [Catenaria anguillulae PL171]|uniref:Actin-related protein 2/3 complex subunit 5 n=1 Tax=Catenaria anguillulae PL171 TaxID=765915 RepID=A0A1Y2HCK8_9FUNG|nr:actin-related protein 2/3 complex subunit 5 [Catenaria anguillulae PL171]
MSHRKLDDAAQARAAEVSSLLARGDLSAALRRALQGTQPYGPTANPAITPFKEMSTKSVVDVLTTARSTDVPTLISQLQPAELDLLFKYLTEVAGVGAIVRVMADKRVI